ncbi:hypothetical protein PanWU01x14_164650 [Parasponia andersonii]|uniref:Uncharacterized protein n=1 Tax=Parasponia andersonii TaxID=3476 RepID=A0A2P5CCE1_PARAD|nr:hypothetical protein PanWU01x14_164650 [Parasponia andersonii]
MGDGELYCQKSSRRISIFDNSQPGVLVFDERQGHWRKLDGNGVMERMPKEIISARIVDVGGRMVMVWVQLRNNQGDAADFCTWYTEIWCTEIEKKKNNDDWWREFHSLNKILLHSNWLSQREKWQRNNVLVFSKIASSSQFL